MLVIEVVKIPIEGVDVDEALSSEALHLAPQDGLRLDDGGRLRCRVELREDRLIQVSGRLKARLLLECGRCLEPFAHDIDEQIDLAFLPQSAERGDDEEVHLEDHDLVVAYYDLDRIDLREMVREQLILGQSTKRLCREDCRGLCPQCGANLNAADCICSKEAGDERWAKLNSRMTDANDADTGGTPPQKRGVDDD